MNRFFGKALFLRSVAILLAGACFIAASPSPYGRNVLILNSYHLGYKWTDDETEGIVSVLEKKEYKVRLFVEYMGTKWVKGDPEYFSLLFNTYKYKFRNLKFDTIVVTDNDAFDFIKKYRDALFPNVPVVFCGVNDFHPFDLEGKTFITGVNESLDFRVNLDLILKMHPGTKRICFITDTSVTGRNLHKEMMRVVPEYEGRLEFSFVEDVTVGEMLNKVASLPTDAVVLFNNFFVDRNGQVFNYDDVSRRVSMAAGVPVYGTMEYILGNGIIGGMLTCGKDHGKAAGNMVLRLLDGEKAENIPVLMKVPPRPLFDYVQMQRFHIDKAKLSADSEIINAPPSFYAVNRHVVRGAIGGFAFLGVVILCLLWKIHRKQKKERFLRAVQAQLEHSVKARTSELSDLNRLLLEEVEVRTNAEAHLASKNHELESAYCKLQEAQQQMLQSQKMEAIGQLASGIAHEINTPIQFIGDNTQFIGRAADSLCTLVRKYEDLLKNEKANDRERRYRLHALRKENDADFVMTEIPAAIDQTMSGVQRVSRIVKALKEFVRTDITENVWTDLNEAIQSTLTVCESEWENDADVETNLDPNLPAVCCDASDVNQVLMNLIVNAARRIRRRRENNEKKGKISIASQWQDKYVAISVADDGVEIPSDMLPRLFDPFLDIEERGKAFGHGMAICHNIIVDKHQGYIGIAGNPEGGSTFTIRLPLGGDSAKTQESLFDEVFSSGATTTEEMSI